MLNRRGRSCLVYNESAFHYFLELEATRAERSGRPILLVLLHLPAMANGYVRMSAGLTVQLIWALADCIRELDFVGWYRDQQVIAAVLTDVVCEDRGALQLLRSRVRDTVSRQLSAKLSGSVRMHVWPLEAGRLSSNPT